MTRRLGLPQTERLGGYALLLLIGGSSAWLFIGEKFGRERIPLMFASIALESGLVAALLGIAAYRRWMRQEWSLIGPA